jgi:hypothetical protein
MKTLEAFLKWPAARTRYADWRDEVTTSIRQFEPSLAVRRCDSGVLVKGPAFAIVELWMTGWDLKPVAGRNS